MQTIHIPLLLVAVLCCVGCKDAPENATAIEKIKEETRAQHPNDPVAADRAATEALLRHAKESVSLSPQDLAAQVFVGFHAKYFHGVPTVCAKHGVTLKQFQRAFAAVNQSVYERTSTLVTFAAADQSAKPHAIQSASLELDRLSNAQKASVQSICSHLEANATAAVEGLRFSLVMPALYGQLSAKQSKP